MYRLRVTSYLSSYKDLLVTGRKSCRHTVSTNSRISAPKALATHKEIGDLLQHANPNVRGFSFNAQAVLHDALHH